MIKVQKIEIFFLGFILVFYFLLLKTNLSQVIYLFFSLGLAIYFFPLKGIILKQNTALTVFDFLRGFMMSLIIVLSYFSFMIGKIGNDLKLLLLVMMISNLGYIYKYVSIRDTGNYIIHILLAILLCMTYFK